MAPINTYTMKEEIQKAIKTLRDGGLILFPTDTYWSIGGDATNEQVVSKMLALTQLDSAANLEVLIDQAGKLQSYLEEVPEMAWDLIELSEKPLTIIYSQVKNLATNLLSDDKSVGIRVTREVFSRNLCTQFRNPIVHTVANINGKALPNNFYEISENIKRSVDYVVNYRQDEKTAPTPSSIIKLGNGNTIKIIKE